jgi:EAL domain-containing protein (putative c-di-GMP-specific phosphodiesterase class I)
MNITQSINKILDDADACNQLSDGLQVASFTEDTCEGNNLPVELLDGTLVTDDQELGEMCSALRKRGWVSATDDSGVNIYARV